ncbi:MAG TPA: ATP-binding protein [Thermoanaerobaculia bacterium]|nr:ATP-binding protein [Thermoanaerobaculia bacterium]
MSAQDEQVRILLVDDQPKNLLALESILADSDLILVKAHSGRAALRHLLEAEFAVILLDVQMPEMDGLETATLVRQRDKSSDTPIIFLTALSRSETNVFRGYELGAVDYIFKPFHPEILRSKVNVFVDLFRKREAIKAQAEELARLNEQTQRTLNAAAEGILGVDLEGRTTFVNPAAARMFHRHVEDVAGSDLHSIAHPIFPGVITCEVNQCDLAAAIRQNLPRENVEGTFFRSDGRNFPVEFSLAPMLESDGAPRGAVMTFRDVTEKRAAALAAESERRYREAEAQNRAKDNFLATLSHELRTPMTSILGWVQFLRTGEYTDEELEEALATIEASGRLQARLIDDMLDVSRIVLGKFQVDLRPVKIADIVEAALTTARPVANERDIRLSSTIAERESVVEADPPRMQQVIGNILSNAIKFTPSGKEVALDVSRIDHKLRVSVTDQGEGIEPGFLPHVFERLRQAEGASKRSGLGLGLAIARHIVELHHGEITAESDGPGTGARFTVILPMAG